ncbi:MAG: hypothetical protein ACRDZ8_15935 [Acidimicrobiales bacterium]
MPEPPEDETALYQVAPPEFVAARDALAKRLRSEGHKADAGRIARLRRPTPAAWALNRVAREQPELVDGVLAAGSELRLATEQAVGGDASGLRAARAKERASVDDVIRAAADHLQEIGSQANEITRQRLTATLRAAIVDSSVAELWRHATLAVDHDAPGFGLEAFSAPAPSTGGLAPLAPTDAEATDVPEHHPPPASPRSPSVPGSDRVPDRPAEVERLEAEAERQTAAWNRLVGEAARARAEAEQLAEESTRLTAEAERLAAEAARVARLAADAEERAADAEARAAAAQQESNEARARAAAARAATT